MAALRMEEMTLRSEGHHIMHLRSVLRKKKVQIPPMGNSFRSEFNANKAIGGINGARFGASHHLSGDMPTTTRDMQANSLAF
jgi:hypothetical protein